MFSIAWIGFWPGLPRLWYRGDPFSLLVASLFALAFNLAVIATFHWPLWMSPWSVRGLWCALTAISLGCGIRSLLGWKEMMGVPQPASGEEGLFEEAQEFYLRGDYFEAEATLHRIFASGTQDVEAAILMVSILRRTGRTAQAIYCIDRLLLLDKAAPWRMELAMEKKKTQEAIKRLESPQIQSGPIPSDSVQGT